MAYTVQILPAAQRQLAKPEKPIQAAIAAAIDELAQNPRPPGVKKLKGKGGIVVSIGHRGKTYR